MTENIDSATHSLSANQLAHIRCVCTEFEELCKSGQHPRIEDHLGDAQEPERSALLRELLRLEFRDQRRRQESDIVFGYHKRFPGRDQLIHEVISGAAASPDDSQDSYCNSGLDSPSNFCGTTVTYLRKAEDDTRIGTGGESETGGSAFPRQLGDYQLIEELGRGGMGVVYRARQLSADRIVALKVIRPERLEGLSVQKRQEAVQRFQTEARAAARLEHDHLVTVYEVGEVEGQHFFSMRYVDGDSLAGIARDGPLESRRSATYIESIARAVHEAHHRGILHRDLKPSNVFVDRESDRAMVGDFGLAKMIEGGSDFTVTGEVFGSPPYMSPEQSRDSANVTVASDIYALGATLYYLLTGRPPFEAASVPETLRRVIEDTPVAPRQFNPGLDRDLETICLTCLEKEPSKRYPSARALADDLHRYLRGEPIQARPVGPLERAGQWCRRNPIVAMLVVAVIGSLAVGTVVSIFFAAQANRRAAEAEEQRGIADDNREQANESAARAKENAARAKKNAERAKERELAARRNAYVNTINSAFQYVERGEMTRVREKMEKLRPEGDQEDLRSFPWYYLWRKSHLERKSLVGHQGEVRCVAFSPDGATLATGSADRTVKLWDVTTENVRVTLVGHSNDVITTAFSPDGKYLATGEGGGYRTDKARCVIVWDTVTGKQVARLSGYTRRVESVAFSPDGRYLATGSADIGDLGNARIYDTSNWELVQTLTHRSGNPGHPWGISSLAFSPDGRTLATGSYDGDAKLWEVDTWDEVMKYDGHTGWVRSVTFSPDGKTLVTGSDDRSLRFWDVSTGKELKRNLGEQVGVVLSSAYTPDGRMLATGSPNGAVLHDLDTERTLDLGYEGKVRDVAISPDGKTLVITAGPEAVLYEVDFLQEDTLSAKGYVRSIAFSSDGQLMASGGGGPSVQIWDVARRELVAELGGLRRMEVMKIEFSPDDSLLAARVAKWQPDSGSNDWDYRLWDLRSQKQWGGLAREDLAYHDGALSPDGTMVALAPDRFEQDNRGAKNARIRGTEVELWDVVSQEKRLTLDTNLTNPERLAFSSDGRVVVAAGSGDGRIIFWNARTGDQLASHNIGTYVDALPLEGQVFVVIGTDPEQPETQTATIWDLATAKLRDSFQMPRAALVDSTRDCAVWAMMEPSGQSSVVSLWDVARREERAVLKGHSQNLRKVQFSPDGKIVATCGFDATVKLWDVATGQELGSFEDFPHPVMVVGFAPQGDLLAAGGGDWMRGVGTTKPAELRLWQAASIAETAPTPARTVKN